MDVAKYKRLFLDEAREHIKGLADGFVALERDPAVLDGVDDLFRHAHSLKGMSASMGYEPIVRLSHALEDLLGLMRRRELRPDREAVDLLMASLDRIERMVAEVESVDRINTVADDLVKRLLSLVGERGGQGVIAPSASDGGAAGERTLAGPLSSTEGGGPEAPGDASERARAMLDGLDAGRWASLREGPPGADLFWVEAVLDPDALAMGARNFLILDRLSRAGTLVASVPAAEDVRRGRGARRVEALVRFAGTADELAGLVAGIPEVRGNTAFRVPPEDLEERSAAAAPSSPAAAILKTRTVRVDTAILDELINTVGELFISHERLATLAGEGDVPSLAEELGNLGGLIRRFQGTIMGVRMMPLEMVAGRFPRMVRDLCRRAGKEVRFDVEGLGIELDRAILEEVGEALVHLLRNAIDHGIETPDERHARGKEPEGRIGFRAWREKEWVHIQVNDDGRGVDLEAVKARALETGAAGREALAAMDTDDLLMLTTLPGFTTAREVTDLSGRGVGLDAVRSRVESFGGSMTVASIAGRGTGVTLRIPLSLAIVRVLTVRAGGRLYGLPVARILRTVEITPAAVSRAGEREFFRDGRALVRLERLGELLGSRRPGPSRRSGPVVVMEKGRRRIGFLVDELAGIRDAVVKPVGRPLSMIPAFSGAAILGDGRPMLILDALRLIS